MKTAGKAFLLNFGVSLILTGLATNASAALTDLGTAPLVNGATVQVKPNIFLMMDDSGSMAWDYMPDNSNNPYFSTSKYGYASTQCNGVFYDPTIPYTAPPLNTPISLTSGSTVSGSTTISFASSSLPKVGQVVTGINIPVGAYIVSLAGTTQATLNVAASASASGLTFTITSYPLSNFSAAAVDGFGTTTTTTINLGANFGLGQYTDTSPTTTGGGPAYYYNYGGTQTSEALKNFYNSSSTFFTECNTNATSASAVFTKVYVGTTSTLAISGTTSTSLTGITVNGNQIMSAASTASTTPATVASNIAARINACTTATTGSCTVAGYRAVTDGTSNLTIIAPVSLASTVHALLPIVSPATGIMTITRPAFSYSGPGDTNEIPNFANWYSYYRTRILMMKSASGAAFNKLDQNYRVGFATMNNNVISGTGNKFLNLAAFDSTQKDSFLTMLYGTSPGNSTPLLEALSKVGLMYADKISTINGVSVSDPMQYSCQQNYAILSTDGFWNNQSNSIINPTTGNVTTSTTAVGNQDGGEAVNSKQYDGSTKQYQSQTGPLQWATNQQWTTAPLLWATNQYESGYHLGAYTDLKQTTAPLLKSVFGYTATYDTLEIRSRTYRSWNTAAANTNYTCINSGNGSGTNQYCQTAGSPTTVSGLTSCSVTYTPATGSSNGSASTDGSSKVVTSCSAGGWSTPTNVGANGSCSPSATVRCTIGTASTSYVSNYPPSCTVSYNAAGPSTADASGNTVTACSTDGTFTVGSTPTTLNSPLYILGPNQSCDWNAPDSTNPHTWCVYQSATGTVAMATYPPVCTTQALPTWVPGGTPAYISTDANGLFVATGGCSTGAFSTPIPVVANGSCTQSATVNCSHGATSGPSYVTVNPPSCNVTYNNPGTSTTITGTSNVVTACSVAGTYNSWADVASGGSCTPGAVAGGGSVNCQYNWGTATTVASCTPNFSSGAVPWTITSGTQCTGSFTGGTSNNLADVAEYYYKNDLRTSTFGNCTSGSTGNTLCSSASPDPYDNVPPAGEDTASWQHMTTFTLGLGARGLMVFDPNYTAESATSAIRDYFYINNQAANGTVCSWQASGTTCTWPVPDVSGPPQNIDDLWHAAVDGRGLYYSATNPAALSAGLTNALAAVQARTGTAAAATTSDPNISQGNNFLFASTFVSQQWTGEFVREQMDLSTGQVVTAIDPVTGKALPVNDWTSMAQLDGQTWSTRNIYTYDSSNANGNKLKLLSWTNLTTTEKALFSDPAIDSISQLCTTPPVAWLPNHTYSSGNQFVASGTPYLVLLTYTSTGTFGVTDVSPNVQILSTPACLPIWSASTFYPANSEYRVISGGNTTWYHVNTAYTSGATFGTTDTTNSSLLAGGTNANGAAGANLVNFLLGDRSNEEGTTPDNTKYFRYRSHVLGDIVDSEGSYVAQGGNFTYADPGFSSFTTSIATRQSMVYVAANDGMLHAFYGTSDNMDATSGNVVTTGGIAVAGGAEAWAYVPKLVQPNLYKLADKNYKNQHEYLVDGTPITGDVCVANCLNAFTAVWKTILVGGLNGGGRGYYALDITNPAHPVALWEFTDTNMGYTYGNPVITKLSDGTWVVLLTSGYNNVTPGDGQGHLYVLNAYTGTLDTAVNASGIINTGVGSPTSPSGLARITAEVVDPATDNTTFQVYGGDLYGNLWRFDINDNVGAAGFDAQLLAQLVGPNNVAQPITTKPEVGLIGTHTVVFVGTGRYLGSTDTSAADQVSPNLQSLYGIYDPLSTTSTPSVAIYPDPRGATCSSTLTTGCFVQQTLSSGICPAGASTNLCGVGQQIFTSSNNSANIPTPNVGWYMDLPLSGQRDNTDPALQRGTLDFTINLPSGAGAACTSGGSSYNLTLDYKTGGAVNTAAVTVTDAFGQTSTVYIAGVSLGNALATRPIFVELPSGAVVSLIRMGTGETVVANVPIGSGGSNTRRVSWRELMH